MGGVPNMPSPSGASLSDILSVAQNLVQAVNALTQQFLAVQGANTARTVAATALIRQGPGRVCQISVTTAGAADGLLYDTVSITSPLNPIYVIPKAVGLYTVNLPVGIGAVVAPGASQVMTVSYS